MSETLDQAEPQVGAGRPTLAAPSSLQSMPELQYRRIIVVVLNLSTYVAMMSAAGYLLGTGGWTVVDLVIFACLMIGTPWAILGFWNAVIGLWLLHAHKSPMIAVAPFAQAGNDTTSLYVKTAVFMTLRNEDPERAVTRLQTIKRSLDATGEGAVFSYFLLSDSNIAEVAQLEASLAAAWQASDPDGERIFYRRRSDNTGFKAGNVREFCERWGSGFELMLPLDADSLMSGEAIVKMARMMQAHPRLGILQSLVVGMPSSSAFARIFQFGMRHGMRSYTMGHAWWVADCGPFWGHNAMVRVEPFYNHCQLPILSGAPPLGGHVLSHDQVEATLMRRAGYEVRVLPREIGSWEENPPTILDFAKREVRWCQGNLQYIKLLCIPGLLPLSRFQLVWAVMMFLGLPTLTLLIALLPAAALDARSIPDYPANLAIALYLVFLAMHLTPKFAGLADAMLTRGGVASFGGPVRFAFSAVMELVFSFLQGAVSTIRTSVFMIGLLFGKSVVWGGQSRDTYGISWSTAALNLWPQTVFGVLICSALGFISVEILLWSLPLTAGYLLAMPFAVVTASPRIGAWLQRNRLCAIPEDLVTPPEIAAVQINAPSSASAVMMKSTGVEPL